MMKIPGFALCLMVAAGLTGLAHAQNADTQAVEAETSAETPAWLGVEVAPVPAAVRAQTDLKPGHGLLVVAVTPDSPAAAAGLQANDILLKFANQQIVNVDQLIVLVQSHTPGEEIELSYLRKNQKAKATVELGKRPEPMQSPDDDAWSEMFDSREWRDEADALRRELEQLPDELRKKLEDAKIEERFEEMKEELGEMEKRISETDLEDVLRDMGAISSQPAVLKVDGDQLTYRHKGREIHLDQSGEIPQLTVINTKGKTVYEGPLEADYAETLPHWATRMLENLAHAEDVELKLPE